MNQLQQTEYEILKTFLDICGKLDLKYYLVCGSALGAVKYGGFIPWDDDVDVALTREDYEVFCKKAPELLPEHLFFQTAFSDPECPIMYGKLRDSRTTFLEKSVRSRKMNHGVYIDVFPLDGYPENRISAHLLEIRKTLLKLRLSSAFSSPASPKVGWFLRLERLFGTDRRTSVTARKLDRVLSRWKTEDSSLWCNHGNWQGKLEYAPKEQYGDGAWMKFEDLTVRVPERYDEYLTQKYGDWRSDLPHDQKVGHHRAAILDLTRPYTDYV